MNLVFLDTETTGLDPDKHHVWEIAYAVDEGPVLSSLVEHLLGTADPKALELNGYWNRWTTGDVSLPFEVQLRKALEGATLVGANPAFDASFLRARWGVTPWRYRLFDVEAYAAGVLNLPEPKGLAYIAEWLREQGHDIPVPDHSAAADVATLRASFRALQQIRKGMQP